MKRYLALFLALIMMFGVVSCAKNTEAEETTAVTDESETQTTVAKKRDVSFTLGYYSNDSLNPYKARGFINASLCSLWTQSLFVINSEYTAEPVLASNIVIEGNAATVTLKDNLYFSDGSSLTANDVSYSFQLAKNSTLFSQRLSNISATVASGNTIVFRMKSENAYCVNCLDFPILKSGTGESDIPMGSGHYELKKSKGKYVLKENKYFSFDEQVSVKTVNLSDISNSENELYLVQVGALTFAYDDGVKERETVQHINANKIVVPQNRLIYVGFNSASERISQKFKQGIKLCLDRAVIAQTAYDSDAVVADRVFNPAWAQVSELKTVADKTDIIEAQKKFDELGYTFHEGLYYDAKGPVTLSMLVCSADSRKLRVANEIKASMAKAGIDIALNVLDYEHYERELRYGRYDMYLGEVKITADMDLSCFFGETAPVGYGIDKSSVSAVNYPKLRAGNMEIVTFVNIFNEDLPFMPICYCNGNAYYSRELQFEDSVCENNLFSNIYSWNIS